MSAPSPNDAQESVVFGFDGSNGEGQEPLVAALNTARSWSVSFNFQLTDCQEDVWRSLFGLPPVEREHSVLVKFKPEKVSAPRHPVKGWPYVGKRYRQACRRWQRDLKRWKRSDGLASWGLYFPRAAINQESPTTYSITPRTWCP